MSRQGNQYLLVAQDYFSKWPFAKPIPDQKADRIVQILRDDVFTVVGPPQKLHSDQGRNFESRILGDLCKAFGVKKSHTTPYPMGDGLVEKMNRSLSNLLRTFVEKEDSWEEHLQMLLLIYRTTKHSTTGLFLFGSNPPSQQIPDMSTSVIPEPSHYSLNLKHKLELREMVDANIVESAERQQQFYKSCESRARLEVLLGNPTKGKLDSQWTGPWIVRALRGPSTVLLKMGITERTVHINRVCPLPQTNLKITLSQYRQTGLLHCSTMKLNLKLPPQRVPQSYKRVLWEDKPLHLWFQKLLHHRSIPLKEQL